MPAILLLHCNGGSTSHRHKSMKSLSPTVLTAIGPEMATQWAGMA